MEITLKPELNSHSRLRIELPVCPVNSRYGKVCVVQTYLLQSS